MSGSLAGRSVAVQPPGDLGQAGAGAWWANRELRVLLVVLAGAAVLFFGGLGRGTLWDQDEAKYTEVAREILQTGDPITLHVNGTTWFVHPPLYMWLQAVAGSVLGFSEFTARLWSAVFGVVGVLGTYLIGRMLFGQRTALLAAIVLMTMFQYFVQSRLAIFDVVLVAFMLLTFYAWLRSVRESNPRLAIWAALWAGLGTLTKGPIAVLLPGLVAVAFLIARGELRRWREIPWAVAGPVYAIIALPWYVLEWIRHGWPFLQAVIGYYTITRFVGVVENQPGSWWYYGPVLALGAFPWTAFLVASFLDHLGRWRDEGSLVVLLWGGITLLFYSIAGTKLPNYILPVYPFAAIGIAATWDRLLLGDVRARRSLNWAFAFTFLTVAFVAYEIRTFGQAHYPADFAALQRHLLLVAGGLLGWLAAATACYFVRRPLAAFATVAGTMVFLAGVLVLRTLPLVEAHRPIKAVAAATRAELRPGDVLIGLRLRAQQTLMYYADHRVEWIDDPDAFFALLCRHPRAVIVMPTDEYERWGQDYVPPPTRIIAQRDGLLAVVTEGATPCSPTRWSQ